ncbi:MAG: TIGR00268 family protein, partial [Angelakisella sp.]
GTAIDPDTLHRVEQGEQYLALHGFTDFRLRVMGNTAKLQLTEEQFPLLMQHRSEVYKALSEQFAQVVLDLMPRVKGD